jgi:hypothetical protein
LKIISLQGVIDELQRLFDDISTFHGISTLKRLMDDPASSKELTHRITRQILALDDPEWCAGWLKARQQFKKDGEDCELDG